jgi:hypothetical protein
MTSRKEMEKYVRTKLVRTKFKLMEENLLANFKLIQQKLLEKSTKKKIVLTNLIEQDGCLGEGNEPANMFMNFPRVSRYASDTKSFLFSSCDSRLTSPQKRSIALR